MRDKPCAPGYSNTPRFGGQQQLRMFFPMYWACYSAIKAYEWAFYPRPKLQKPLLDLAARLERQSSTSTTSDKSEPSSEGISDGDSEVAGEGDLPRNLPGTKIPLEIHLLCSLRGGGWDWGPRYSINIPPPRPFDLVAGDEKAARMWREDRIQYLKGRLQCLFTSLILVDIIDGINKSEVLWGVLAGEGAPIIDGVVQHEGIDLTSLPWAARMYLSFTTGCFIVIAMALLHSVPSFVCVLPSVLWPRNKFIANYTWSDPSHWSPPMVDLRIWSVGSVRKLWSAHWHQVLRRCFLVAAYNPTKTLVSCIFGLGRTAGAPAQVVVHKVQDAIEAVPTISLPQRKKSARVGKMIEHGLASLAVFALSGMMHELFIIGAARNEGERSLLRLVGLGPPTTYADGSVDRGGGMLWFFTMQWVACFAEEVFEAVSGWKVGGPLGTVWTLAYIAATCPPFAKVWWYFGIANGPQINPFTRRLIDWTASQFNQSVIVHGSQLTFQLVLGYLHDLTPSRSHDLTDLLSRTVLSSVP
ncbi:hypothetical protein A4X13_0g1414 [Tilletia indica]|uniref:Wax synthase domain-containing protein n=1 Tax=Tilletia indica TaxID=43049 RepID=A0A177TPM9_9BASI|nr:hypothetical protein A4X13_0g1414 [Tilletia indica]